MKRVGLPWRKGRPAPLRGTKLKLPSSDQLLQDVAREPLASVLEAHENQEEEGGCAKAPSFQGGRRGLYRLCFVLCSRGAPVLCQSMKGHADHSLETRTLQHTCGERGHTRGRAPPTLCQKRPTPPFPSSTPTTFLLHGWQMRTGDGWHHCPCGSLMGPGEEGSIFSVFLCLHSLHPSEQFCLPSPAHAQACTCRVLHAEPGFTRTRHWRTPGRPAGLSLATCLGATTHGWLLFLPRSPQQEPGCAWPAPHHCHLGRAPLTAI